MTIRQIVLKLFYPVLMKAGKVFGLKATIKRNKDKVWPISSFYNFKATTADGAVIDFDDFKGRNILIVNTASGCGYTNQLSHLEKLQQLYKKDLVIIAFPSNDFKEQERLADKEISLFCNLNFGTTFLITKKSVVLKEDQQNEVFAWLSNKQENGWNETAPEWNFSKYLVNKTGVLTHYFGPGIDPLSNEVTECLRNEEMQQ
jgi:glutathione peroxidase